MKGKDKVLKKYPQAQCYQVDLTPSLKHWHVNIDGVCYGSQPRQNWAWAEAVRIIKQEQP